MTLFPDFVNAWRRPAKGAELLANGLPVAVIEKQMPFQQLDLLGESFVALPSAAHAFAKVNG
jgi:hypothetical protein